MERLVSVLENKDLSVTMRLAVRDDRGATHYTMIAILSGRMPKNSGYSVPDFEIENKLYDYAIPAELGYHAPCNISEVDCNVCDILDSKCCNYYGSTLDSDPVHQVLFNDGIKAAWAKIEELHDDYFSSSGLNTHSRIF